MPAYIGNKKVKELYYGGKKVQEAWYGSKKVFSMLPEVIEPWWQGKSYETGDVVSRGGKVFVSLSNHRASTYNEPSLGPDWEDFWRLEATLSNTGGATSPNPPSSTPTAWRAGVYYRVGDLVTSEIFTNDTRTFQCLRAHTSNSDTEPYYGVVESAYWKMV